jgi:hypothetical protein
MHYLLDAWFGGLTVSFGATILIVPQFQAVVISI